MLHRKMHSINLVKQKVSQKEISHLVTKETLKWMVPEFTIEPTRPVKHDATFVSNLWLSTPTAGKGIKPSLRATDDESSRVFTTLDSVTSFESQDWKSGPGTEREDGSNPDAQPGKREEDEGIAGAVIWILGGT